VDVDLELARYEQLRGVLGASLGAWRLRGRRVGSGHGSELVRQTRAFPWQQRDAALPGPRVFCGPGQCGGRRAGGRGDTARRRAMDGEPASTMRAAKVMDDLSDLIE
jgi:hypothetical protein